MRAPRSHPDADVSTPRAGSLSAFIPSPDAGRFEPDSETASRCRAIDLLVLDVDGVLTDGRITYTDDGIEIKSFHVRDGSALVIWRKLGKRTAILSGRVSGATERRAAELGIGAVVQGASDKREAFRKIVQAQNLQAAQVCVIGDDLPDLPALVECGLAVAVADACMEVKAAAHFVTRSPGGRGAVRETVERILRCQGRWPEVVAGFRGVPGR